jgi:hypothetical protein
MDVRAAEFAPKELSSEPDPVRVATLTAALLAADVSFVEEGGLGFRLDRPDSALVQSLERDWPDDFERQAALWRFAHRPNLPLKLGGRLLRGVPRSLSISRTVLRRTHDTATSVLVRAALLTPNQPRL